MQSLWQRIRDHLADTAPQVRQGGFRPTRDPGPVPTALIRPASYCDSQPLPSGHPGLRRPKSYAGPHLDDERERSLPAEV